MPGNLNKIWEAVRGNYRTAWNLSRATGATGVRSVYRGAGMVGKSSAETRRVMSMASRAMAGATIGAGAGAIWGAISDRESIVSGALKGAFVGGASRVALRGFNPRYTRGLSKLNRTRDFRENLRYSWNFMSQQKNRTMRNWIVGMGLFGATRGMMAGDDNPLGGAAGGTLAGGIQGAGIYGGYRLAKKMYGKGIKI